MILFPAFVYPLVGVIIFGLASLFLALSTRKSKIVLTKDQKKTIKNLQIGIRKLKQLAEEDRYIIRDFSMERFGVYQGKYRQEVERHDCNTAGCLLGNLSRVLPITFMHYENHDVFCYSKFQEDMFPALNENKRTLVKSDYGFLFSTCWEIHQPTFHEAIDRAEYYIHRMKKYGELGTWDFTNQSYKIKKPLWKRIIDDLLDFDYP